MHHFKFQAAKDSWLVSVEPKAGNLGLCPHQAPIKHRQCQKLLFVVTTKPDFKQVESKRMFLPKGLTLKLDLINNEGVGEKVGYYFNHSNIMNTILNKI